MLGHYLLAHPDRELRRRWDVLRRVAPLSLGSRALAADAAWHVQLRQKLQSWVAAVEAQGLNAMRRIPGYHDEPLAGRRAGQRSIRLSKGYRAVYTLPGDGSTIQIEEVTKHAY